MGLVTKVASILGLLMIGAMTAQFVTFQTILQIPVAGSDPVAIQTYLDSIFKGIVPLALTLGCLGLMRKNINVIWIIIGVMVLGMALGIFGIC
jgi:PTS system mannose-specific IID component